MNAPYERSDEVEFARYRLIFLPRREVNKSEPVNFLERRLSDHRQKFVPTPLTLISLRVRVSKGKSSGTFGTIYRDSD